MHFTSPLDANIGPRTIFWETICYLLLATLGIHVAWLLFCSWPWTTCGGGRAKYTLPHKVWWCTLFLFLAVCLKNTRSRCRSPLVILFLFVFRLFQKNLIRLTHALICLSVACQSACLTIFTWRQQLILTCSAKVYHNLTQPVFSCDVCRLTAACDAKEGQSKNKHSLDCKCKSGRSHVPVTPCA